MEIGASSFHVGTAVRHFKGGLLAGRGVPFTVHPHITAGRIKKLAPPYRCCSVPYPHPPAQPAPPHRYCFFFLVSFLSFSTQNGRLVESGKHEELLSLGERKSFLDNSYRTLVIARARVCVLYRFCSGLLQPVGLLWKACTAVRPPVLLRFIGCCGMFPDHK